MRYTQVGDREIIAAAERIGEVISRALDGADRPARCEMLRHL